MVSHVDWQVSQLEKVLNGGEHSSRSTKTPKNEATHFVFHCTLGSLQRTQNRRLVHIQILNLLGERLIRNNKIGKLATLGWRQRSGIDVTRCSTTQPIVPES